MADAGTNPWLIVLAGFGGTLITAGIGLIAKFRERGDKREERRQASVDADRMLAAKELAESFQRTREDLSLSRVRVSELERDLRAAYQNRDLGWDLARRWCDISYDLAGRVRSAQSVADGLWRDRDRSREVPAPVWQPFLLPKFEDAIPKQPEAK